MKNIKPSGKTSGGTNTGSSNSRHISGRINTSSRTGTDKTQAAGSGPLGRKLSAHDKQCTSPLSGSHDNLSNSSNTSSVRRKVATVAKPLGLGFSSGLRPKADCAPIRTLNKENILATKVACGRKISTKSSNLSNMRRAASRESVDSSGTKEREKENVAKPNSGRNQNKTSNNCATILQLEKEKGVLEHQISELVRNAESKKAEIATLKMEINRLKELQSDDTVDHLRQEVESLQVENQSLKERLIQMGVSLETAALSDSEKEQLLLRRSMPGSMASLDGGQSSPLPGPSTVDKPDDQTPDTEGGEASGVSLPPAGRPLSEWDKASSSSLSEMSVACLQDRIMQMEETHHSTNEELQATLQELTDLQDQLTDLQLENERMGDEKAVLLESLCSQTEKLEECRSQIAHLKELLFQQHEEGEEISTTSERERHLVDLLKKAHEEHEMLLMKQDELTAAVQAAKDEAFGHQAELVMLRDHIRLLESTVESINADKRLLETQLNDNQEQLSANQIENSQLKLQLENEQQKVVELQRERKASATSEIDSLLQETRKDKEKVEERVMRLQEQLALSQREAVRLKDQVNQMQEENMVAKNNARKQVSDMEYRVEQLEAEKDQIQRDMTLIDDALQQAELKCQRHLEDKRELKATVGELQKALNETTSQWKESQRELDDFRDKHVNETEEWRRFQADLLTTVRVANDFKTEAQQDVERLVIENKQLKEKTDMLETELEKMKAKQEVLSPTQSRPAPLRSVHSSITFPSSEVTVLNSVEKDLATARRQLSSNRLGEHRGATQLSVRSLIESIENATKQAKGPASSRSSSTSSVNSVASESRSTSSLLLGNSSDIFIKPSLRPVASDSASLLRDNKSNNQTNRLQRNSYNDGNSFAKSCSSSTTLSNEPVVTSAGKTDVEPTKSLPPHPVSILASKLEPMRRNSYGDLVEKKDPLSFLVKGGGSKRNALLKWCQNKAMGYKGIDITNFSSSWNDGLAFCALLHSYLPHLIPYNSLDSKDKKRNFTIAFQAAESVGIPTTLNINDLICLERPDWQSIMTYVTSIYKHFET